MLEKKDIKNIHSRWQRNILGWLNSRDPFMGELLTIIKTKPSFNLPTARIYATEARIYMEYNPLFIDKLSNAEARWVVCHELAHVFMHHITMRLPYNKSDRKIWNQAADLAINQIIGTREGLIMVPDPKKIKILAPEQFSFKKKLSLEQYYILLNEYQKEKDSDNNNEKKDGNGDGNGDEKEDNKDSPQKIDPKDIDSFDDHSKWSENGEIVDEMIRRKIKEIEESDTWGIIFGDSSQEILAAQKSQVKWYRVLREYFGRIISEIQEPTHKRPNRRFGYPFAGVSYKHIDKVLFAFDSSGSISDKTRSQLLTEINKASDVLPIDLIVFDCGIQLGPIPWSRKRLKFEFNGYGGTSFEEPFKIASQKRYKSIVCATDGEAQAIPYPQGVHDVIWLLFQGGKCPVTWGRQIHIKDNQ